MSRDTSHFSGVRRIRAPPGHLIHRSGHDEQLQEVVVLRSPDVRSSLHRAPRQLETHSGTIRYNPMKGITMASELIATAHVDLSDMADELAYLRNLPRLTEVYDEFSAGTYRNHSLWNSTGDSDDSRFTTDAPGALITEYGRMVPKLESALRSLFVWDQVRMVRARNLINATIFPHRDFVEFDTPSSCNQRVFLAVDSAPFAFHSDDSGVFSMRSNEIWFVDAAGVHSAANLTSDQRLHICIDFVFPEPVSDLRQVLRPDADIEFGGRPHYAQRAPLPENFGTALEAIGAMLSPTNLSETLSQLTKLHFTYESAAEDVWAWLETAAYTAPSEALRTRISELRDHVLLHRAFGGGYDLARWNASDIPVTTTPVAVPA